MPLGSITPVGFNRFDFVNAKILNGGRVPRVLMAVLEEISCEGIDFDLDRLDRRILAPFYLRTLAEALSYDAAESLADDYERSVGVTCTWVRTVRGVSRTYKNVSIRLVGEFVPSPSPPISSASSLPGAQASLQATWQLRLNEVPT